jgi:hypothetical protein
MELRADLARRVLAIHETENAALAQLGEVI